MSASAAAAHSRALAVVNAAARPEQSIIEWSGGSGQGIGLMLLQSSQNLRCLVGIAKNGLQQDLYSNAHSMLQEAIECRQRFKPCPHPNFAENLQHGAKKAIAELLSPTSMQRVRPWLEGNHGSLSVMSGQFAEYLRDDDGIVCCIGITGNWKSRQRLLWLLHALSIMAPNASISYLAAYWNALYRALTWDPSADEELPYAVYLPGYGADAHAGHGADFQEEDPSKLALEDQKQEADLTENTLPNTSVASSNANQAAESSLPKRLSAPAAAAARRRGYGKTLLAAPESAERPLPSSHRPKTSVAAAASVIEFPPAESLSFADGPCVPVPSLRPQFVKCVQAAPKAAAASEPSSGSRSQPRPPPYPPPPQGTEGGGGNDSEEELIPWRSRPAKRPMKQPTNRPTKQNDEPRVQRRRRGLWRCPACEQWVLSDPNLAGCANCGQ